MNFLLKGTNSVIRPQIIRNQKALNIIKNNSQLISRQIDGNQTVLRRRFSYSTALIILSQTAPFVAFFSGRYIGHRWPDLKNKDKKLIMDRISQNRLPILSAVALICGSAIGLMNIFTEETPLTKRRRFVIFQQKDYEPLSDVMSKVIFKANEDRLLPADHKHTKRVHTIVKKILVSNKEFKELADKNWSVYVIRSSKTVNAFVLPTGHIFVYSGIMNVCDNDDQLAAILAHELSHTLLNHPKETMSQDVCLGLLHSMALFLFFIRFRPMKAFLWTIGSALAMNGVFITPKRRTIEYEADYVGVGLAAKACYDVREASAFWLKMSTMDKNRIPDFLSTHPSNRSRSRRMDSFMDAMIKIRECSDCPQLSKSDPRKRMRRTLKSDKDIDNKDIPNHSEDYKVFKK